MPSITAGQSATFTLDAFGYIDIIAAGDGTLNATSRAPNLKSNVSISKLASVRYGPYGVPMDFVIACTNGTITYTTTSGYTPGISGAVSADEIWNAAGDTVYGTGPDAATRLPIGTAGQILAVNSGATAPEWRDVADLDLTPAIRPFYFSAAGDYIAQLGPGTAYDVFFTSFPNLATVTVYDNTSGTSNVKLATVTNSSGVTQTNYSIPIGTPPTYSQHLTAIRIVTTGVTVGQINVGE